MRSTGSNSLGRLAALLLLTIPAAGGVDTTSVINGDFSNGNDGVILKGKGKKLADIKAQKVNLLGCRCRTICWHARSTR